MHYLPTLLLVAALAYWPGLSGGFVFDDHVNILGNPSLKTFDGSLVSLWEASMGGTASPLGRPLSLATFALNLHFGGDGAFYFKLANLLIHLANGLLVYWLVRQAWPRLVGNGSEKSAALWVTAFWLLHPINLTSVLFVVQRMTSLSAFFTLAALNLYLLGRGSAGGRRWVLFGAGFLFCWPAGMLAKESAILLPLYILLCEWLVLGSLHVPNRRTRWIAWALSSLVAAAVLWAAWPWVGTTYGSRDFTPAERLLTEARVLWLYVQQLLLPWPDTFSLHHDDIVLSRSLFDPPATLFALAGLTAAIGTAIWQRQRRPWLGFAIFWFLAGHSLESSVLGLEIAYEHRNYLPSLGVAIGLAAAILPARTAAIGKVPRFAFAWALVIFCGLVTGLRADQWGDEYVRTQIEANTHPASARTNYEAAQAILERTLPTGFVTPAAYHMARFHFQRATELDPRSKSSLLGILYLDCAIDMPQDKEVRRQLMERMAGSRYTIADQQLIQSLSDLLSEGLLCLGERDTKALLAAALSNPSADARLRGMLHAVAMDYAAVRLGSLPQARRHAQAAVESDPGNPVLRINLIRVLLRLGETAEARKHFAMLRTMRIPAANRLEVENLSLGLDK